MRIFKTRWFHRWARREGLSDTALVKAVDEMARGLVDANLGGHVYKKRVAVAGRGKSGGLRTLIAYRMGDNAFFVYGFAKSERANIAADELEVFRDMAADLLAQPRAQLQQTVEAGRLIEVTRNE